MRTRNLDGSDGQACLGALLGCEQSVETYKRSVIRIGFCFKMEIIKASTIHEIYKQEEQFQKRDDKILN